MKHPDVTDEQLGPLEAGLAAREAARRKDNALMKPLSEIDLSQFAPEDHISSSYYRLPDGYPNPVCSGRHLDPVVSTTLNETYCGITTGSENFKLKHKQEHEEILFKTEDSIYSYDHQILQLRSVLR